MKRLRRIELDHEHATHADEDGSLPPSAFKVVHLENGTETAGVASLGELLRCLRGEDHPTQLRAPGSARQDERAGPSSPRPAAPIRPVERSREPPVEAVEHAELELRQPPAAPAPVPQAAPAREPPVEPVPEPPVQSLPEPPVELVPDPPAEFEGAWRGRFDRELLDVGELPVAPRARGGHGSSRTVAWWLAAALTILAVIGAFLALFTHELDAFVPGGPGIEFRISRTPARTSPDVQAPYTAPPRSQASASRVPVPATPAEPVQSNAPAGAAAAAPAPTTPTPPPAAASAPAPTPRVSVATQAPARATAPSSRTEVPAPPKPMTRTMRTAAPAPAPADPSAGPAPRAPAPAQGSSTPSAASAQPAEQPQAQPEPRAQGTRTAPAGVQPALEWTQARWGMSLDDVVGLFPAQRVRTVRATERRIDGLTAAAELTDVRIASHLYAVSFLFDGRAALAAMEAHSTGANDRADAFDEMLAWLSGKYGAPASKASAVAPSGELLRTAHWRARDTAVELQGRAAPNPDRHTPDPASGDVRPFRDSQVFLSYRPAGSVPRLPGSR